MSDDPPARDVRVGIVGPLLGHHPGWVVSQGERLAERLASDGLVVRTTSGRIGRIDRAIDTARSVHGWSGEVDIVVVMVFSGPAFAITSFACMTAGTARLPVVLWLHGGNLPDFARRHPRWVGAVLGRARAIVAPSAYLARAVRTDTDTSTDTESAAGRAVTIIPNLLDTTVAPFASRAPLRPRLLWMRTFHPLYRPEWAIETLGRLLERFPDATLTMAGQDRGELATVRAAAAAAGLTDRVHFSGFLDAKGKERAFADHDVFVNTTATDNAPVSLLEAAAHGLPIVSTAVGGIADLFPDGVAAVLADDPQGLADGVSRLLTDSDLATSVSAAAHQRACECTWEQVGPQWHRLLGEIGRARP